MDLLHNDKILTILFNVVGMVGVAMMLFAYLMLQLSYMKGEGMAYSMLNFVGAVLLLVSLMWSWNLPSVVIELCWMLISLIGIVKIKMRR